MHTLITQLFVEGGEHLDSDTVFGVKAPITVPFPRQDGPPPHTAPARVATDGCAGSTSPSQIAGDSDERPTHPVHPARRRGDRPPHRERLRHRRAGGGSGPAGGTAAALLATYGVRTRMVTKYGRVANSPRAHITNQRAMEVFRDLGIEDLALRGRDAQLADG